MRHTSSFAGIAVAAGIITALSGCSGGTSTPEATVTRTVTAAPAPTSSSTPTSDAAAGGSSTPTASPTCGTADAAQATSAAVSALPSPGIEGATWDAARAETSGYDACAPLSWVVVTVDRATASSPAAILLFHDGRYLGTATKEQYGFEPAVSRTDPSTIAVTYRYPEAGESSAEASGRAEATFTWDDSAGRVLMRGDVPPEG
jgi:hypothetical protein